MTAWLGFLRSLIIYHNPATIRSWRRFYAEVLTPGDLVFDVGAHMCTRARAMRAGGARVVALEPQAPFTAFLRYTLPRDITLLDVAAGPTTTLADLAVSTRHPTVSSLRADFVSGAPNAAGFEHVRWDRTQQVRVVTLDSLITQYGRPAYVKIDVEGFEIDVLLGLSTPVPLISVEYLPAFTHLTRPVIDRLLALGPYRFNVVAGETGRFLWPEWRDASDLLALLDGLPPDAKSGDVFARLSAPG